MKRYCLLLVFAGILCAVLVAEQTSTNTTKDTVVTAARLTHTIDIKKAKVGDEISLHLMDNIALPRDGKIIPYGKCRVVGHISSVQVPTKENPQSMIAIEFDRIEMRGEGSLRITATITGMEPAYHYFGHAHDSEYSVANSGDNPQARAAPPMVDSNGRPAMPSYSPLNDNGPVIKRNAEKDPSPIDNLQIKADAANRTTTIISNNKQSLLIEDGTTIRLIVRIDDSASQ